MKNLGFICLCFTILSVAVSCKKESGTKKNSLEFRISDMKEKDEVSLTENLSISVKRSISSGKYYISMYGSGQGVKSGPDADYSGYNFNLQIDIAEFSIGENNFSSSTVSPSFFIDLNGTDPVNSYGSYRAKNVEPKVGSANFVIENFDLENKTFTGSLDAILGGTGWAFANEITMHEAHFNFSGFVIEEIP